MDNLITDNSTFFIVIFALIKKLKQILEDLKTGVSNIGVGGQNRPAGMFDPARVMNLKNKQTRRVL